MPPGSSSWRATSPIRRSSGRSSAAADGVVNFAAESHVDRSILDPEAFLSTGVIGVHVLLEACRWHPAGRASCRSRRRGVRLGRRGSSDRGLAARPALPVRGGQGGRRAARARLCRDPRRRRGRDPRLEHVRAVHLEPRVTTASTPWVRHRRARAARRPPWPPRTGSAGERRVLGRLTLVDRAVHHRGTPGSAAGVPGGTPRAGGAADDPVRTGMPPGRGSSSPSVRFGGEVDEPIGRCHERSDDRWDRRCRPPRTGTFGRGLGEYPDRSQIGLVPGVGQLVEHRDPCAVTPAEQVPDMHTTPDEPGTASDKDVIERTRLVVHLSRPVG